MNIIKEPSFNINPIFYYFSVEFEPGGTSSDDEETIAKAEADEEKEKEAGVDKAKEIELLQKESELPLEDLLKDYLDNRENIVLEDDEEDDASSVVCFYIISM